MNKHTDKLLLAGGSIPLIEGGMALLHTGAVGAVVGLGISGLVYVFADELKERGVALPTPAPSQHKEPKEPGTRGLAYKLLNGKSSREQEQPVEEGAETVEESNTSDIPPQFLLDDVLSVIEDFNSRGYVYFGDSATGAIAIKLEDMYHVLDVASSGKGKSNRLRLAMMQISKYCATYYINPLAAPVKAVNDDRRVEVWKPIYDLLAAPVVKEAGAIGDLLASLTREINRRNERETQGDFDWRYEPIFVFVDELPEVFKRCPDAAEYLDTIGRMGRQYGIFTYLCAQSANVKVCGLSTPAQANCKTRIYGGGDATSSTRMMNGKVPTDTERTLQSNGAGLTLMLAEGMNGSDFVRAPLVTNEGLFEYLELPPFQLDNWYRDPRATSVPPSNPLQDGGINRTVQFTVKASNEAGGSGLEVEEVEEVEEEAENDMTEREKMILDMFLIDELGPGEIARKLSGGSGGSGYQKASTEVTVVLRKWMKR